MKFFISDRLHVCDKCQKGFCLLYKSFLVSLNITIIVLFIQEQEKVTISFPIYIFDGFYWIHDFRRYCYSYFRTCLRYFLPPNWKIDKESVSSMSLADLAAFPLDDFFDHYEKGLRKVSRFSRLHTFLNQRVSNNSINQLTFED